MIIPLVDNIITGKSIALPSNIHVPEILVQIVDKVNTMPKLELLDILTIGEVVMFLLRAVFVFLQT